MIGIQNDSSCSFCKEEEETIIHLFCDCEVVKNFYNNFENMIYEKVSVLLNFTKTEILFGRKGSGQIQNLLILLFKYYIYRQRCKQERLYLPSLVLEIYNYYRVQRYISIKNNKLTIFEKKMAKI